MFLLLLLQGLPLMAGETVTLEQLLSAAWSHRPILSQMETEARIVRLRKEQVVASYLPEFHFQSTYQHQSEVAKLDVPFLPGGSIEAGARNQYDLAFGMDWLIFDGFRRRHQVRSMETTIRQNAWESWYQRNAVAYEVYMAVYQYWQTELVRQTLEASRTRLSLQMDQVRSLFRQGLASRLDTLELFSRLRELDMELVDAVERIRSALVELEKLSGLTPIDSVIVDQLVTPAVPLTDFPIEGNYRLKMLHFQQIRTELERKSYRSRFYPSVSAFLSWHYARPGVNYFEQKWMDYWITGLRFQWNLFRWGADRKGEQILKLELDRLQWQEKELRDEIQTQIKKLRLQRQTLLKKQTIQHQTVLDQKERYLLVQRLWEQGQKSMTDLLQTEKEMTVSELKEKLIHVQLGMVSHMMNWQLGFVTELAENQGEER